MAPGEPLGPAARPEVTREGEQPTLRPVNAAGIRGWHAAVALALTLCATAPAASQGQQQAQQPPPTAQQPPVQEAHAAVPPHATSHASPTPQQSPAQAPAPATAAPNAAPAPALAPTRGPPPTSPRLQSARHTDAHADRVILSSTAETHPKGTIFLSSYELIFLSAGYAFSDRLQASVTGFTNFDGAIADFALKANLLRSRWLRVSAQSGIELLRAGEEDLDEGQPRGFLLGRIGATAQICFELACRASLSLSGMLLAHDDADILLPLGLAAGFTARLGSAVSLLLEYGSLFNAARDLPFLELPAYAVAYGARIAAYRSWALDITLIRLIDSDDRIATGEPELFKFMGVPFFAFTYRFLP